jgi:hypothetical protein
MFEQPATPSTGIEWGELSGALLIIEVREVVKDINTVHGPSDAVRADVYVVDGPHAGDEHLDALIFSRGLRGQLNERVGHKVLGRLGQGVAKPGQNPPWKLANSNDADKAAAEKYLASRTPALTDPF